MLISNRKEIHGLSYKIRPFSLMNNNIFHFGDVFVLKFWTLQFNNFLHKVNNCSNFMKYFWKYTLWSFFYIHFSIFLQRKEKSIFKKLKTLSSPSCSDFEKLEKAQGRGWKAFQVRCRSEFFGHGFPSVKSELRLLHNVEIAVKRAASSSQFLLFSNLLIPFQCLPVIWSREYWRTRQVPRLSRGICRDKKPGRLEKAVTTLSRPKATRASARSKGAVQWNQVRFETCLMLGSCARDCYLKMKIYVFMAFLSVL